jgi:hypothetical protein
MEIINSFFNNIKEKLTNPFFGTLILVLIVHHWQLWYTVFNFDQEFKLVNKVNFIKAYAKGHLGFWNLMLDVLLAMVYMLLGYLIIVATRSLVLWVEHSLMPFLTGKIVSKNIVTRSEYDTVVKEREEYFDQYEEQRKNVRNFSKTIDEQTEQIKKKDFDLLKQSETISDTVRELDRNKKKVETLQKEKSDLESQITQLTNTKDDLERTNDIQFLNIEKFRHLFFDEENESFYDSPAKFPPEIRNKVEELMSEGKWKLFLALGNFFEHGGTIGGEALTQMINKDIAFERGSREDLTPVGKIIWRYRKIFDPRI